MKHLTLIITLLLLTLTTAAQGDKKRAFNERLFNAKVTQIVKSLNMSEEKQEKFVPVYRRYSEEMIRVWNELVTTSKDETEQLKYSMKRQERSQAVRIKYTDEFAKFLTGAEIKKFYQVENEIQRRLREKKQKNSK